MQNLQSEHGVEEDDGDDEEDEVEHYRVDVPEHVDRRSRVFRIENGPDQHRNPRHDRTRAEMDHAVGRRVDVEQNVPLNQHSEWWNEHNDWWN